MNYISIVRIAYALMKFPIASGKCRYDFRVHLLIYSAAEFAAIEESFPEIGFASEPSRFIIAIA